MEKYLFITLGAVPGAFCRYWLTFLATSWWGTKFPYGVLIINLIGSFVLGLFLPLLNRGVFPPNSRYLVAVGWCATFTTYSTFSWDTYNFVQDGNFLMGLVNVGVTVIGCFVATWMGVMFARAL